MFHFTAHVPASPGAECLLVGTFFRCWCRGLLVPSNMCFRSSPLSRTRSGLGFVSEMFRGERHRRGMLSQVQMQEGKSSSRTRSSVSVPLSLLCCFWAFLSSPRGKSGSVGDQVSEGRGAPPAAARSQLCSGWDCRLSSQGTGGKWAQSVSSWREGAG